MKKHHWLFVVLSALALVLVSCSISEYTAPTLYVPGGGLRTDTGELVLRGSGLAGYQVQALVNGQVAGVTPVGADGVWSMGITLTQPGEHRLTLQTLNPGGIVVGQAQSVTVTVAAPVVKMAPPTLDLPTGALEAGNLALTGTGEPGSQVQVLVDGQVTGAVQVGADGKWSLGISVTEAGDHELTMQTLDAGGQMVAEAEPVTLSLAPVMEAAQAEVTAAAGSETAAPGMLFPIDGADVLTGQLTLIGSGQPDGQVEVLNGSLVLGTAEVGADGEWRYTFEPTDGDYQFAVRPVADTSTPDSFVAVRVSADKDSIDCWSNPGIDRGEIFIVGTCDTMEDISKLKGIDLEDLIAANPQVEDPDMVYPGQIVTVPE